MESSKSPGKQWGCKQIDLEACCFIPRDQKCRETIVRREMMERNGLDVSTARQALPPAVCV